MIVFTAQAKCEPTKNGNSITGFGNHTLEQGAIHYTAGLIIADRISRKAIYETKKEVMDEVLIPAFKAAGSTAPEGLAQNAYGALRDEKKIVEML
jgi:hypothetical protein